MPLCMFVDTYISSTDWSVAYNAVWVVITGEDEAPSSQSSLGSCCFELCACVPAQCSNVAGCASSAGPVFVG